MKKFVCKLVVLNCNNGIILPTATANAETQFVEDAVRQLLKARRVLKCSYIYGYYLDGPGYKKIVFEFMQVLCFVTLICSTF